MGLCVEDLERESPCICLNSATDLEVFVCIVSIKEPATAAQCINGSINDSQVSALCSIVCEDQNA